MGHSLVRLGVDSVKNAGPVSWIIVGAQAGAAIGPIGAAFGVGIGAAFGTFNWAWGKFDSKSKDKFYNSVENRIDNVVDKGKSIANSFNTNNIGKAIVGG